MYKHILKKKIKDFYKKNSRKKQFLNLNDIHTILILFDTKNYEEADEFIEKLKKLDKKVTVYAFKEKSDQYDYTETPYRIITSKEAFDLFDNKMTEIADELENVTYDAVFDLTIDRNIPLEYLLARSNAYIKTGLKKNDLPQYDLAIAEPDDKNEPLNVKELGKQIVYYLHTIKAN
ncbi:MAG: hypothetical protein LIO93_08955 [Bacteroidales bacterium]|nr:hypothetical protein [Bacteroidales bacterium]